jgi:hypothetical protein
MPFLLALVVVVIAITAILVINMGGGDEDAEQIGRAVVAQNDALQRQDYQAFKDNTCAAEHGTEDEVLGSSGIRWPSAANAMSTAPGKIESTGPGHRRGRVPLRERRGHPGRCRHDLRPRGRQLEGVLGRTGLAVTVVLCPHPRARVTPGTSRQSRPGSCCPQSRGRLVDCRTEAEWRFVGVPDLARCGAMWCYVEWTRTDGSHNDDFIDDLGKAGIAPAPARWSSCAARATGPSARRRAATAAGIGPSYNVLDGFRGRPRRARASRFDRLEGRRAAVATRVRGNRE